MPKNAYIRRKLKNGGGVNSIVEDFLDDLKVKKYSPRSLKSYGERLKLFFQYLDRGNILRVQDVTSSVIDSYRLELADRKLSPGSIDSYLRTLKVFFRYLEKRGTIFVSPAADLVMPRPKSGKLFIPTESNMKKFLSVFNVNTDTGLRNRALAETAYSTGARRRELLNLTIFDPDFRHGTLTIAEGKGGKDRVVPLGKHALFWLDRYISSARNNLLDGNIDVNALWISDSGGELTVCGIDEIFRHNGNKVNLKIRSHAVRRACATHMLTRGAHPARIQALLGHSSLETLSRYLRITLPELKKTHGKTKVGK